MSDTMLHGVLCMPPELWQDTELDKRQRYSRYLAASRRIEDDERAMELLRDAVTWRPIETAPKDGTHVLLFVAEADVKVTGGYWSDHRKCHCWIAGGYMRKSCPPTHWMPLHETPNA